jgi:hypothetical protein
MENWGEGQEKQVEAASNPRGQTPVEGVSFPLGRDQEHFRADCRQSSGGRLGVSEEAAEHSEM